MRTYAVAPGRIADFTAFFETHLLPIPVTRPLSPGCVTPRSSRRMVGSRARLGRRAARGSARPAPRRLPHNAHTRATATVSVPGTVNGGVTRSAQVAAGSCPRGALGTLGAVQPIADTPQPPYYAVVFTSERTPLDGGYGDMAERMVELASQQPGFLGVESVRGADGAGITSSYWADLESIRRWKANVEHLVAQRRGREGWYARYRVRVARVERDYGWPPAGAAAPAERRAEASASR